MTEYGRRRLGLSAGVGFIALLGLMATIVSWPTEPAKGVAPNPHTVSGTVNGASTGEVVRLAIRSEGADGIQVFVECRAANPILVEAPIPPSTAMTYRFPLNFPEPGGFPGCSPTGSSSFAQVCIGDRSGHAATQVVLSTGNPYSTVTLTRQANKPCPAANWMAGRGLVQGFVFVNGQVAPDNTLVTYTTQGGCATDPAAGALTQTMQIPDPPNPTVSGALYSFEILFPTTGFGGCNVVTFYVNGQAAQVSNANGPSDGVGTPAANPYTVMAFPKKFGFTVVNLSIGSGFAPGGNSTPTAPGGAQKPQPTVNPEEITRVKEDRAKLAVVRQELAELIANEAKAISPEAKAAWAQQRQLQESVIKSLEAEIERVIYLATHPITTEERERLEREFRESVKAEATMAAALNEAAYAQRKATWTQAGNGHIRPTDPDLQAQGATVVGFKHIRIVCGWVKDTGPSTSVSINLGLSVSGGYIRDIYFSETPRGNIDRSQGAVWATAYGVRKEVRTPTQSGALIEIVGAKGDVVEFLSDDGTHFFFDVAKLAFVDPY
jgi:hypothetical protein